MRRTLLVFRRDLRSGFRRPMIWVLLAILALTAFGLSSGNMRISSGDSTVGGTKAWITSEFAQTQMLTLVVGIFYIFFVAVAAGMAVIQDQESQVGEILHSTPLKAREYVWGKFLAVLGVFAVVLAVHQLLTMIFFQALPNDMADEIRGPFGLVNYLRPAILMAFPTIIFMAGLSFAIGERWRKPILVFFFPVFVLLTCAFFLWNWTPSWLDPRIDRVLMLIDPTGFRWLNQTWLTVDRGVEFYNSGRVGYDWGFLLINRLGATLLGIGGVALSARHFARRLRAGEGRLRKDQIAAALSQPEAVQEAVSQRRPLSDLAMAGKRPGFVRGSWIVARVEMRELRSQPGLYLFVPLILLQAIGTAITALGAFGTPILQTSGGFAVNVLNTLTLLIVLLLLFYTVESLQREWTTRAASIFFATPVKTTSILFGKALANSLVGGVIVFTMFLAAAGILIGQGMIYPAHVPFEITPFAVTWGFILIPTFLVWTSFVTLVHSLTRNRYSSYAIGLAALIATGYFQMNGDMNWAFNWDAWNVVRWSDMGTFELNRMPLILNRLMVLGLAMLFTRAAVRFFQRQEADANRIIHRLHPLNLLREAIRMAPFAAIPAILGATLYLQVDRGFQGDVAQKRQKDYWRRNIATWKDAETPATLNVDLDVELRPADRWFHVKGSYLLSNPYDHELRQIPLTAAHWKNLSWTLDGQEYKPDNRVGLYVFTPREPMPPGGTLKIGFEHESTFPAGITRNGGGTSQFVLPSGVVLHNFGPSFIPTVGYLEQIGVDADNRSDAREYPDDYYKQVVPPAFGSRVPYTTQIRVTAPSEYIVNSVGTLESEEEADGKRTVTWKSDHPVKILNIVAGRWDVREGEGTAIFYHPSHTYNIDEMIAALDAARRYYSEWFGEFPWRRLKVSEFPNLASYAQGFPTDITFSEGIGFLTKSDPKTNAAFLVTAHESAHQWWGNMLTPGDGPGGNILSEGMSHFSTMLLMEQVKGLRERIEFAKRIEERYGDNRQVDSERPLIKIDGSRPGDTTVTYDKGGWVFWMTLNQIGRERALEGLREFMRRFSPGPDHAQIEDYVQTMREFAPDPEAFDAFAEQWFFQVVVPEYKLSEAERTEIGEADVPVWEVTLRVKNAGTGKMPVEVAALLGDRFAEDGSASPDYRESRVTMVLDAGAENAVTIRCPFKPDRVIVDPDAVVLQLERDKAVVRF